MHLGKNDISLTSNGSQHLPVEKCSKQEPTGLQESFCPSFTAFLLRKYNARGHSPATPTEAAGAAEGGAAVSEGAEGAEVAGAMVAGADIRGLRLRGMGVRSQGAGTGAEIPKSPTPSRVEDIRAATFEGACEEAAMGRCRRCLGLFLRLCPYVHMRMKGFYIWNERGLGRFVDSCTDFTNEQPCLSGRDEHGVSSGSHIQCFADAKSPGWQDG